MGMTNKEAKEHLKDILCDVPNDKCIDWIDALKTAIKALEQQSSEDCISRDEAIRIAEQGQIQGYEWQFKKLCDLPSVTPTISKMEQVEDCISRKALEEITWEEPSYTDALNAITEIRDKIRQLPSVTPQQTEWIPVSERLPKAFEFVNCTCHSLIDDREDWVIETVYVPQPSDSPYSDWGNIPMLNSGDCEVVAWMHRDIPEPYKAGSEDRE